MKSIFTLIASILITSAAFCQTDSTGQRKTAALTVGILQGGGGLLGIDFEKIIYKRFSVQVGAGIVSYGAGINYHFKPTVRSSFISLQYWNQGIGASFTQNALGATYVFRGKKWFTFQIGAGHRLQKGPAYPENRSFPAFMLLYSIGAYFPL